MGCLMVAEMKGNIGGREAIGIGEGKNGELRKLSKWLPWFPMTEIRIVVIRTWELIVCNIRWRWLSWCEK